MISTFFCFCMFDLLLDQLAELLLTYCNGAILSFKIVADINMLLWHKTCITTLQVVVTSINLYGS
jgi:hypothetical protein